MRAPRHRTIVRGAVSRRRSHHAATAPAPPRRERHDDEGELLRAAPRARCATAARALHRRVQHRAVSLTSNGHVPRRRRVEAQGDVSVACSRPTLTRLLHTTGFDRIVPVTDTLDAAVEALLDPPDDFA